MHSTCGPAYGGSEEVHSERTWPGRAHVQVFLRFLPGYTPVSDWVDRGSKKVYTAFFKKMTIFFQNPKTRKKTLKTTPKPYTLNSRTKVFFGKKVVIFWKKVDLTWSKKQAQSESVHEGWRPRAARDRVLLRARWAALWQRTVFPSESN